MEPSDEGMLSQRLGLLKAICEERGYFGVGDVRVAAMLPGAAAEAYGEDRVPKADTVVFETWGPQPVLAGVLHGPDPAEALPFLRYAAVAKQTLGERAIDLLMLLIAPTGVREDREWAIAAAAIEDDDRICRKLVWLPDADATKGAERLLGRSPFARPWRGTIAMDAQASTLDQLLSDQDPLDELAVEADKEGASAADFLRSVLTAGARR